MKKSIRIHHQARKALRPIAASIALAIGTSVHAGLIIPDTPLVTGSQVPPNILFILDDSGSMAWDTMPGASGSTGRGNSSWTNDLPYSGSVNNAIRYMAANINTLWYDPTVTYTPGTKAVVGFVQGRTCELGEVSIAPASKFAAIYVTAREPDRTAFV